MKLVYLSPVKWSSYLQRPHFMVKHFLACGGTDVLWVNPYPARLPQWSDLKRSRTLHEQGTTTHPHIHVVDFPAAPLEPIGGFPLNLQLFGKNLLGTLEKYMMHDEVVLGIGKPSRLAAYLLDRYDFCRTFYDAMDDFPEFHTGLSRRQMLCNEAAVVASTNSISVSSHPLVQKFSGSSRNIYLVLNAFCPETIDILGPAESRDRHIFGYVGSIGDWFDWDILRQFSDRIPEHHIHLVGPLLKPLPNGLPKNVKIFPPCAHDKIMDHYRTFSAGLIPFKVNRLTHCVDPIKFYEYYAMGLPVLTTDFGEMSLRRNLSGVFFLDEICAGKVGISQILSYRPDHAHLEIWRKANSWDARFKHAGLFEEEFA